MDYTGLCGPSPFRLIHVLTWFRFDHTQVLAGMLWLTRVSDKRLGRNAGTENDRHSTTKYLVNGGT